jgi:hypothetical protein
MEVKMSLVRLIYASRFARKVGPNDVQAVLAEARTHNEEHAITGVLCYDWHFFLQCLEGSREEVNRLYVKISADERHKDVTILEFEDINERLFPAWSMAYVRIAELTEPILLKYTAKKKFDPYDMSGKQALGFIKEISDERKCYLDKEMKSFNSE